MKSLLNNALNQIKEYNCRLKEKEKVIEDLTNNLEQLRLQKVMVEERSLRLTNKYKALEEQIYREMDQLDKKKMHKFDSNSKNISNLSDKSCDYDKESDTLSGDILNE